MNKKIYIVGAKRTPIGSFLGSLANLSAAELGVAATKAALLESHVPCEDVDEVIMGHVLTAGQGQGVARQIAIGAGCPVEVPASSVHMVCGSGLKAVLNGWMTLQTGMGEVLVAGGVESMSQAPHLLPHVRSGQKLGNLTAIDSMVADGLTDAFSKVHMGITAENVAETYQISREEQDDFAYASQQKAIAAQDAGIFKEEIVAVETTVRRQTVTVSEDEYINRTTSPEKLTNLRPAFKKEGTVTAGNASGLNDGGSATVLVTEEYVSKHGLKPLVEIVAFAQTGIDPQLMGMGPVSAIEKALEQANLKLSDIDTFEINEAFASQSVAVLKELAKNSDIEVEELAEKVNPTGGAIALGHPIGASGNRILVTLIHRLRRENLEYGVASLCIGGGMGIAIVVHNSNFEQ